MLVVALKGDEVADEDTTLVGCEGGMAPFCPWGLVAFFATESRSNVEGLISTVFTSVGSPECRDGSLLESKGEAELISFSERL